MRVPYRAARSVEDRERLASKIRTVRTSRGLAQEDLAQISGIRGGVVSAIERGVRDPTLATLEKIARGLDVSVCDLL